MISSHYSVIDIEIQGLHVPMLIKDILTVLLKILIGTVSFHKLSS